MLDDDEPPPRVFESIEYGVGELSAFEKIGLALFFLAFFICALVVFVADAAQSMPR